MTSTASPGNRKYPRTSGTTFEVLLRRSASDLSCPVAAGCECLPSRDGRTSDFWNIFTNVVTLKPFNVSEIDEFLGPIGDAGFRVDAGGKQAIIDWTGGIPVLAARLCGSILASCERDQIDGPTVEAICDQIAFDAWMQDTLTDLWDDCGKEIQGDLLDIAGDALVAKRLHPTRQQLLSDRGYIVRYGGAYKAQCRFMQLYAAGHEVRSRDLRDLFKDPETELRSLKTLLQLRLSSVDGGIRIRGAISSMRLTAWPEGNEPRSLRFEASPRKHSALRGRLSVRTM